MKNTTLMLQQTTLYYLAICWLFSCSTAGPDEMLSLKSGNEKYTITMPEESEITLNDHSTLQFKNPFNGEVYLTGEAYVSVPPGCTIPIQLIFNNTTITCKAGAFNINTYNTKEPVYYMSKVSTMLPARLTVVKGEVYVKKDEKEYNVQQGEIIDIYNQYLSPYAYWSASESITWTKDYYDFKSLPIKDFYFFMSSHFMVKVYYGDLDYADLDLYNVHIDPRQPLAAQLQKIAETNKLCVDYNADSATLLIANQ